MIDRSALFADETGYYCTPLPSAEGGTVRFRFRAKKGDALKVTLLGRALSREMGFAFSDGVFDYYETSVRVGSDRFYYWFAVDEDPERIYYNRLGLVNSSQVILENAFAYIPGFTVPEWAKGAVIYQIFTDRFCNGDPSGDVLTNEYSYLGRPVVHVDRWDAPVESFDVHRFYGGDLEGVRKKLPYLKHLGIDAIYFNPLFVSPSNHKYDIQDYDHIDPHFTGFVRDGGALLEPGDRDNTHAERYLRRVTDPENLAHANAYFAAFVEEAHAMGIRVILDGVFNHCGSFNRWMDREKIYESRGEQPAGAFLSGDSPYRDFFSFDREDEWPDNTSYAGWWNNTTLPKLNYEDSPELWDYIMGIARKWVAPPYRVDGWRLDVAADLGMTNRLNHKFWRDFRKEVKAVNPDALIVAEHYGNPEHWLRGDQWDTVMNYDAFMEPVSFFLTGMEKHSDEYVQILHGNGHEFFRNMNRHLSRLPEASRMTAMNELSNHDHSRFLTRTKSRPGRLFTAGSQAATEDVSYATFREGVVMQFTLPGAPTIYYGDETGMGGWTDPDNRRTFPWGHESWDLITFHRDMIRIHKTYSCLKDGSYKPLQEGYGYIAYGRFDRSSSVLTVINHSDFFREIEIPVWYIHMPREGKVLRVMQTGEAGYNVGALEETVTGGVLRVTLPAWSGSIYAYGREAADAEA
ncbi:MAG: glycoside hydrolase family 13 protein [Lachnospiraceae bacterium]|nr:glycoside hydrolase family 13 protein [Lachnospiraceae bacterium]